MTQAISVKHILFNHLSHLQIFDSAMRHRAFFVYNYIRRSIDPVFHNMQFRSGRKNRADISVIMAEDKVIYLVLSREFLSKLIKRLVNTIELIRNIVRKTVVP